MKDSPLQPEADGGGRVQRVVRRQQPKPKMKIYEVWHDGYDGYDETRSHWFARQSADETAARLNREQPQETFGWEVVEHEVSFLPTNNS